MAAVRTAYGSWQRASATSAQACSLARPSRHNLDERIDLVEKTMDNIGPAQIAVPACLAVLSANYRP